MKWPRSPPVDSRAQSRALEERETKRTTKGGRGYATPAWSCQGDHQWQRGRNRGLGQKRKDKHETNYERNSRLCSVDIKLPRSPPVEVRAQSKAWTKMERRYIWKRSVKVSAQSRSLTATKNGNTYARRYRRGHPNFAPCFRSIDIKWPRSLPVRVRAQSRAYTLKNKKNYERGHEHTRTVNWFERWKGKGLARLTPCCSPTWGIRGAKKKIRYYIPI